MKPMRCIFGQHDYGDWIEMANHLESTCKRCGYKRAKYKDPGVAIVELLTDLVVRCLMK